VKKILLGISGLALILVIFGVFSSPDSFDSNDYVVTPTTNVLIPIVSNIQSEQIVTKSTSIKVLPDSKEELAISTNGFILSLLAKAYAVSSSQLDVSVTFWELDPDCCSHASFDPQGNIVTIIANKVGKLDASTNVLTQWTLSGSLGVRGEVAGDSAGNIYFGQSNNKIVRLDPITNIFTEWVDPVPGVDFLVVDSEDNVFFATAGADPFMSRLDPTTNTITTWNRPISGDDSDFVVTNSFFLDNDLESIYFIDNGGKKVFRFDYGIGQLTSWSTAIPDVASGPVSITADSTGTMFFTEIFPFSSRVARLDPSTNTLTEWQTALNQEISDSIAVDSSGNVFFDPNSRFTRLVPSTNTFTQWDVGVGNLKVDSSDLVQFYNGGRFGFIT